MERASVDEAYLDLTEEVNKLMTSFRSSARHGDVTQLSAQDLPNTHVVGFDSKDKPDACKLQSCKYNYRNLMSKCPLYKLVLLSTVQAPLLSYKSCYISATDTSFYRRR